MPCLAWVPEQNLNINLEGETFLYFYTPQTQPLGSIPYKHAIWNCVVRSSQFLTLLFTKGFFDSFYLQDLT